MNTNITQLLDLIAQIDPNKYLQAFLIRRAGRGDPQRDINIKPALVPAETRWNLVFEWQYLSN